LVETVLQTARSAAVTSGLHVNPFRVMWALAQREWVRFVRQRTRVVGAIGQPLLFWFLFSAGLGPTFRMPGAEQISYQEYFFPGTVVLILLFTAIFTTISVIEDRREGFLQSVLVAPIPRWSMVGGKLLGGSAIALAQALLCLAVGWWFGIRVGLGMILVVTLFLFVLAVALTGLGFLLAWRMDSTQGFHAIMSVFLMPMWLLSGAFFPAESGLLAVVLRVNPLSYGVAGLRHLLSSGGTDALAGLPALSTCWFVTIGFALVTFGGSYLAAARRTTGDLL
jgi:ABC-2 type transport system permease protein